MKFFLELDSTLCSVAAYTLASLDVRSSFDIMSHTDRVERRGEEKNIYENCVKCSLAVALRWGVCDCVNVDSGPEPY